jgi:hypothetical protein
MTCAKWTENPTIPRASAFRMNASIPKKSNVPKESGSIFCALRSRTPRDFESASIRTWPCSFNRTFSSPERVKDGRCWHKCDFALLQPIDERLNVFPILTSLLKVIENSSAGFIDLAQDETRVACWGRAGINLVRELRTLGHVVAQESFLPFTVVRSLHPSPVTFKDAITLRHLIGRGNENAYKLNLVVIGHSIGSPNANHRLASRKKGSPQGNSTEEHPECKSVPTSRR